ncbi:MAG: FtsW/RodA/SpoVE family cell cycle protein, partial [Polyangiaceae bacterium]|nr:FtsW/RodA/SpoVE family cell cycle protein [Polyangiaceae bacterium]
LGGAVVVIAIGAQLVMTKSYRLARLEAYLDIAAHRQDIAYQPFQSVVSFGSGGVTGLGLGRGLQVLYLPEAHNDFIAAIIGEEMGFIGIVGLASVFLLIVARGVRAAFRSKDDFGAYLAFGIAAMLGVQALVNMAVAMAILPTKGLTLPFVSYGGSSLVVNAAAIGVLLNISRKRMDQQAGRGVVRASDDVPEESATIIGSAKEGPG